MRVVALALALVLCSTAGFAASLGEGVVMPLAKGQDLLDQCSRDTPDVTSYWLPDAGQIADLEKALDPAIASALAKRVEMAPDQGYDRQYIGIVTGGQKRIYINGFIHELRETKGAEVSYPPKEFWRTNAVVICGGGSYYFGAIYDLATKKFSDFAFNGMK